MDTLKEVEKVFVVRGDDVRGRQKDRASVELSALRR
jgi:hypothetical protein